MKQKIVFYLFLLMTTMLMSCSDTMKDASDILSNLSKPKNAATMVDMMIYAEEDININESNEPTPVNFIVLELKRDDKLYAQDYESLSGDIKKALGKSYINHEEYTVEPGKFIHIEAFEVKKGTRYIAVVGAYRALDKAIWRASSKISDKDDTYSIHVVLKKEGVKMEAKK